MGKLIKHDIDNLKENMQKYINKCSAEICCITYEQYTGKNSAYDSIKAKVDEYYSKNHDDNSIDNQSGRVWALILKNESGIKKVYQVAQALDKSKNEGFFGEIYSHVYEIYNKDSGNYKAYADKLQKGESLVFYEIKIDSFLKKCCPFNNYKQIIYEITREYMVEALFAELTQAEDWGYWNSGMDKRAYYRILNEFKKERKKS